MFKHSYCQLELNLYVFVLLGFAVAQPNLLILEMF